MKKFLLLVVALLLVGWLIWGGEIDATEVYLQGKVYAAEIVGEGREETKIELAEYQIEKIQRLYEEWMKDFEKRKAELEDQVASSKLQVASSYAEASAGRQKLKVKESKNVLDKWILARLNQLINEVTDNMNDYNLPKASRPIENFVSDFSTWYIRRSRDRFKEDDEADKKSALETTGYVLLQLSKVMAPFMPFKAESVWQKVTRNNFKDKDKSVHLEEWPTHEGKKDFDIFNEMQKARELTEQILAARDERGFRVRQPIGEAIINFKLQDEYKRIVEEECNIKKIDDGKLDKLPKRGIWRKFGETLAINFELSPELKMEGAKRELVRFINALRKQTGMTIQDRAVVYYETDSKEIKEVFNKMGDDILKDTLSDEIVDSMDDAIERKEVKVNNEEIILGIKKV